MGRPAISGARTGSVTRHRRALATPSPVALPPSLVPISLSLSAVCPERGGNHLRAGFFSRCSDRRRGSETSLSLSLSLSLPASSFSCPRRRDRSRGRDPPTLNELADAITSRRRRRRQQLLPAPTAARATGPRPGRGFKKAAGAPVQDEADVLPHGQGRAAREAAGA